MCILILCIANIFPLTKLRLTLNSYCRIIHHVILIYASHQCFMLQACWDFSVIFVLWRHHPCKLSLCNGEVVVPAPRQGSVSDLQPHVHSCYYLSSLRYLHPPSDQHVTVTKEVMPSKPAEGKFWALRSNVVGVSSPPPQWNPLWWIFNEHNRQDVILILYLSAFVCKLSIMEKRKKNPACICSWFCHEMTLPNVWYCFLYWKRKKIHDCGCSKIML